MKQMSNTCHTIANAELVTLTQALPRNTQREDFWYYVPPDCGAIFYSSCRLTCACKFTGLVQIHRVGFDCFKKLRPLQRASFTRGSPAVEKPKSCSVQEGQGKLVCAVRECVCVFVA